VSRTGFILAPDFEINDELSLGGTGGALHGLRHGWLCLWRARGQQYCYGVADKESLSGWVYGGGLEYAWNKDLILHAGYRRIDFDDQTFSVLPVGQNTLSPEMDVLDFGLVRRY
jgi:opacity protein-like surface antigen